MKDRCTSRLIGGILLTAIVCGAFFLACNGVIGVPEFRLEQDLRTSQQIPDSWTVLGDRTAQAAVFLFYPPDQTTYGVTVYRNEPGLSFGYFFRGSHMVAGVHGSTEEISAEIEEIPLDGTGLIAYVSLNAAGIQRMEQNDGNTVETHLLDGQSPFVFLLPQSAGEVTFYDGDGTVVETQTRNI